MGNHRFRVSNVMSSSWFCKIKNMGRANRSQTSHVSMELLQTSAAPPPVLHQPKQQDYMPSRAASYIPSKERGEELPRSPITTNTSKPWTRRKDTKLSANAVSSASSVSCTCHHNLTSVCKLGSMPENNNDPSKPIVAKLGPFHVSSSVTNININMASKSSFEDLEVVSELNLPPILTKPVKRKVHKSALHDSGVLKEHNKTASRRSVSRIHRIKVRQNSPSVGSRKVQACKNQNAARTKVAVQQRRALSDSLVVIKSSSNPRRDFTESMVEMIVENNIREMKDLEELLAWYLSLNSKEYHEVIIKVFEHIWLVLTGI